MKKRFFLAAMTLLVSMGASAQGNGIGGITEATNMVTSYFDPGTKLIYAIGAVIGLIGGGLAGQGEIRRYQAHSGSTFSETALVV